MNFSTLNFLDYFVLTIIIVPAIFGIFKGFLRVIFGLIGTISGIISGILFTRPLGNLIFDYTPLDNYFTARLTAFFVLFFGCWAVGLVIGFGLRKIIAALHLTWLDRVLGAFLGALKGIVLTIVICIICALIPDFKESLENSQIVLPLVSTTSDIIRTFPLSWQNYLNPNRWIGTSKERIRELFEYERKKGYRNQEKQQQNTLIRTDGD